MWTIGNISVMLRHCCNNPSAKYEISSRQPSSNFPMDGLPRNIYKKMKTLCNPSCVYLVLFKAGVCLRNGLIFLGNESCLLNNSSWMEGFSYGSDDLWKISVEVDKTEMILRLLIIYIRLVKNEGNENNVKRTFFWLQVEKRE